MKKALLAIIVLCMGLMAQAQQDIIEGYLPEGDASHPLPYAADFITTDVNVENVYWWNQRKISDPDTDSVVIVRSDSLRSTLGAFKPCYHRFLPFVYKSTRNEVKHALEYEMDLPYGVYQPVGVGFGEGNTLDISQGNAFVAFTFKNTSTTTLDLTVGLQDSKKSIVNSLPKSRTVLPRQIYTEEVKFASILPGATFNFKINFNPDSYPAAPYYANYPKDTCDRGLTPSKDSTFDYRSLAAVTFTIVNNRTLASPEKEADGFKPLKFKGTFEISKFRVGTYDSLMITGLEDEAYLSSGFNVYPNPVVSGRVLHLNAEALNIKVMDVLGNVVLSAPKAKQIEIALLNKGVYVLQSSRGTRRFVIE